MGFFQGKRVYITGGSSGIGLCAAEILAQEGALVSLFARNREKLNGAVEHICTLTSPEKPYASYCLDVADNRQVQEVMEQAVWECGAPHILINSAGRAKPLIFEDITYDQFDETMHINLYGARNTIAALLPAMKEEGGGHIVNVSSMAGLIGVFGYTDYCASKFALVGFSEALRSELDGQGIGVSVLCPPDTDTPGLEEENLTKPVETQAISASANVMQPEDVAKALLAGIQKNKFLIIPGVDGKVTWWAKRLVPGVVNLAMKRAIKKVRNTG